MQVLITVASKHGSTREIALAMGDELTAVGHQVAVYDAGRAPAPDEFEAVILGSAVYMGNWMSDARDWVEKHEAALRQMPVWLFSSGPLGEDPQPKEEPAIAAELTERLNARGHTSFVGALDKSKLGLGEKLIVRGVKAPYGDFRDWDNIHSWAQDVAAALIAA